MCLTCVYIIGSSAILSQNIYIYESSFPLVPNLPTTLIKFPGVIEGSGDTQIDSKPSHQWPELEITGAVKGAPLVSELN